MEINVYIKFQHFAETGYIRGLYMNNTFKRKPKLKLAEEWTVELEEDITCL